MSQIHIQHPHQASLDVIRNEINTLADELSQKYGARCQWTGDCQAKVKATGVDGSIQFDEREVTVKVKLGFMVSMLKSKIEADIRSYLEKRLPTP